MSLYQRAFEEAVLSTIWPLISDTTSYAMFFFGGFDMPQVVAFSALGVMVATLILWLLGRAMYEGYCRIAPEKLQARYRDMQEQMRPHGVYMVLFMCLPIGVSIGFSAGFLRFPLRETLPLSFIGAVFFYAYQFLY